MLSTATAFIVEQQGLVGKEATDLPVGIVPCQHSRGYRFIAASIQDLTFSNDWIADKYFLKPDIAQPLLNQTLNDGSLLLAMVRSPPIPSFRKIRSQ